MATVGPHVRSGADPDGASTLYSRLGGRAAIAGVVGALYERLLDDDEIGPFFAHTDLTRQRAGFVTMLVTASGGPVAPHQRPLDAAHAGRGITHRHFSLLASHLVDVLLLAGVDGDDANSVMNLVAAAREQVVGREPPR